MRRGACPSLAAPMTTGDGLLVRLRPARPGFALDEFVALAEAADLCGNGIIEVTARGNLQIRGLRAQTVPTLAARIAAAGIDLAEGVAIETPPLAGLDPSELSNPLPLAARLRAAVAACQPQPVLAPKLSIIVDGGGRLHLGGVTADIRLRAVHLNDKTLWLLALAGTETTARRIALLDERSVLPTVLHVLDILSAMGGSARGRDIDAGALRAGLFSVADIDSLPPLEAAPHPADIHELGPECSALGVGLAFGQIRAQELRTFIEAMATFKAREIRLSPGHALMVLGIAPDRITAAQALALGHEFRAFPRDPRNHIAACAGMGACASARIDTRALAQTMISAGPSLLDGSLTVHVSGCAKGCARPSASTLTITAAPIGYGLVVNGLASAAPNAYIEENTIRSAIERLEALVQERKQAGESARSCLTRLGADAISAAVQQG